MSEHPYSRESVVRLPERENLTASCLPGGQTGMGASRYCAYNETRERFVCIDVEGADFSAAGLNSRLPELTPGCGKALWILPFRGISATSVRVPIDLLYLDSNFVVLAAVESFPIFQPPSSTVPATSVLALPGETIGSTQTRPGDRLILCPPEELRRQLLKTAGSTVDTQAEQDNNSPPGASPRTGEPARKAAGNVLPWVNQTRPNPANEGAPGESTPIAVTPAPESVAQPGPEQPPEKKPATKNWLNRWLNPEPPDPRTSPRLPLTWLAAWFFTGGTPKAHGVRDISSTGIYVFTEERWYLGTVIRMTLADLKNSAPERSMTVNAKVVRWGNDGVGLKFILVDRKRARPRKDAATARSAEELSSFDVEQFIELVRSSAS